MSRVLTNEAQMAIGLSAQERIDFINASQWIGYPEAKSILDAFERLRRHPKISRMPNALLVGESNNGKTELLRRFLRMNPPSDEPGSEYTTVPVIYIQMPPKASVRALYSCILDSLFVPYWKNEREDNMLRKIVSFVGDMGLRVLIMDEFQHVQTGTALQQRHMLNAIKYLGNELEISILAAGTKEAFNALNADQQFSNRFEPIPLPRWKMDKTFLGLLVSMESTLPLKRESKLRTKDLAMRIFAMSEGTIGEIVSVLKKSAIYSIENGMEVIDLNVLEKIPFVPPSQRRKRAIDMI